MKNHPTPEEWMSFLYGEDPPARHAECSGHLRACPECHQRVQTWRASMVALDAWVVPQPCGQRPWRRPLRWAAAAAVVLALGFVLGRATSSASADSRKAQTALRSEMESRLAAVREELRHNWQLQQTELAHNIHAASTDAASDATEQLFTKLAKALDERREADHETYLAALKQIEEQRLTDYATLRTALDTVAVNADDGLSRAQEQLIELAAIARPTAP